MDNASKALVMVGAILISVMLISLGVFLFTYARDAAEDQTGRIDELTVSAFNQQFGGYLGENISGTTVKALISTAKAADITVYSDDVKNEIAAGNINSRASYKVEENYGDDGKINTINVLERKVNASGGVTFSKITK